MKFKLLSNFKHSSANGANLASIPLGFGAGDVVEVDYNDWCDQNPAVRASSSLNTNAFMIPKSQLLMVVGLPSDTPEIKALGQPLELVVEIGKSLAEQLRNGGVVMTDEQAAHVDQMCEAMAVLASVHILPLETMERGYFPDRLLRWTEFYLSNPGEAETQPS